MDFVNWDTAGSDSGFKLAGPSAAAPLPDLAPLPVSSGETNMDLVLGDVAGDDWSFWALEHFESTHQMPPQALDVPMFEDPGAYMSDLPPSEMYWESPPVPCTHCALGGYSCKRIREGKFKGYCTSCVALRCGCSLGPDDQTTRSEAGETFPANPWPIMGDRPATSILHEDDLAAAMNSTLAPPQEIPQEAVADQDQSDNNIVAPRPILPKVGARFSRESVKVLKNWVSTHSRHPYPSEEEKESLQKITGLNKTQITNWLANARRRGKIHTVRSTSPHVGRGYASAMEIPRRRGTSGIFGDMNPLQRWANSPPENEPASVTAIARAVTASSSNPSSTSGINSPYWSGHSDDGSGRSLCNQSSASSLSHSQSSGGSFASSFSRQSRGSFGSLPSFARTRGRRRRRRAIPPRPEEKLQEPLKTFQCTFCTETFRTKHDWQRHEKSLHLSLERWVCSPDGPKAANPTTGLVSCVFCGEASPDDAHIESHNFSSCTERCLEERTFYRKDHLRQHLKLVHNVKFLPGSMDRWRVTTPSIRSRCGFCGDVLDNWSTRVDHLAEHFKSGQTMAQWKGDWGFDAPVLEMVENSIPPYLIHDERNSPLPFKACESPSATPNNAYALIKYELRYWAANFAVDHQRQPTDEELQEEACSIIYGCELRVNNLDQQPESWLRDLIVSNLSIATAAMFRPTSHMEGRMSHLRINSKKSIFESCDLERDLHDFVKARQLLGLTALDNELQEEACKIIGRMEEKSGLPCEGIANWLLRLIFSDTQWLAEFRKRAHLPRTEDIVDVFQRSKDPKTIDSTIHNYSRLDNELGEYLQLQRAIGIEPTNANLQRQARIIIYENDDDWNQTAADDAEWLSSFRDRHPARVSGIAPSTSSNSPAGYTAGSQQAQAGGLTASPVTPVSTANILTATPIGRLHQDFMPGPYFLNDANCYRRLAKDLKRFAAATMSANNPSRHVPTDEELQHQARWIVYDDDDPWNRTAADNMEWLQRFKRDAGILPPDSNTGLSMDKLPWSLSAGGTGFAPPYVAPNPNAVFAPLDSNPKIVCREGSKEFEPDAGTANRFLQTFTKRYEAPAKVFCSRELENGLSAYVKREVQKTGVFPTDEQLRVRARDIMGMQSTPADDANLLAQFKSVVQQDSLTSPITTATGGAVPPQTQQPCLAATNCMISEAPDQEGIFMADMDLNFTEQELDDLVRRSTGGFAASGLTNSNL